MLLRGALAASLSVSAALAGVFNDIEYGWAGEISLRMDGFVPASGGSVPR